MPSPIICTIIAKNYLPQARCLTESFLAFHPDGKVYALIVDEAAGDMDAPQEQFEIIPIQDIAISHLPQMRQRYSVAELCCAVKPFFLEYLFQKYNLSQLFYFDPDIYFYGTIEKLEKKLEANSILLTPHVLGPLSEAGRPNEFTILQAGAYNLGFLGLSRGPTTEGFLQWWQERLVHYSRNAPAELQHYDQRWVDLVPGMFWGVTIDRGPGHNAAYWDLPNRKITQEGRQYLVNGQPLIFFHFSGYRPDFPQIISRYQDRWRLSSLPVLRELFETYGQRLLANGYGQVQPAREGASRPKYTSVLYQEESHFTLGARLYRKLTSLLAGAGLEVSLTRLLGRGGISRIQRAFVPLPRTILHADARPKPGINVLGFFENAGSSGEGARRLVRTLHQAGLPVSWTTLERAAVGSALNEDLPRPRREKLSTNIWYVNPDYMSAMLADNRAAWKQAKNIGYWAWELSTFPKDWCRHVEVLDEIWVYSNFIKDAIEKECGHTKTPIVVMGAPLTTTPPAPFIRQRLGLPLDTFVFLFMFDFASYLERKNPEGLIEAYQRAFPDSPCETLLVIKTINGRRYPHQRKRLRKKLQRVGGVFIDKALPRSVVNGLISESDAYVSLHRCEGFGLTLAEAMQFGKPVIATHYSGNTDFMTNENSYPIPYQLTPIKRSVGPYRAGEVWAEPDLEDAARAMRQVVENPEEAQARGQQAAVDIAKLYGEDVLMERIQNRNWNLNI